MDDIDFDRIRGEMGMAKFQVWLDAEPVRRRAHRERIAKADKERQAAASCRVLPPSLWRVHPAGHGLLVINLPLNVVHRVLAIGEPEEAFRHWIKGKPTPCFLSRCGICKDSPGPTPRDWYFDSILERTLSDGRPELFRAITSIPNKAAEALEGRQLRGLRMAFRKVSRGPTQVEVIEQMPNPDELPPPVDVRAALVRIWQIPYWPSDEAEESSPKVLPFRKQA